MGAVFGREVPAEVVPGQVWADNDIRSADGTTPAVLVVLRVWDQGEGSGRLRSGVRYAEVARTSTSRVSVITASRLLSLTHSKRGYTFVGMN